MMLFLRSIAFLALAVALGLQGGEAAPSKQASQFTSPMRVALVRSDELGCEPDCATWISAEGAITAQTPTLFSDAIEAIGDKKVPIVITSPGGDVDASYAIGRMIRAAGLDVVVGRTVMTTCAVGSTSCTAKPGQELTGTPTSHHTFCASACAFVLAAGIHRYVDFDAVVGVHQLIGMVTYVRRERLYSVRRRLVEGVPVEVSRKFVREFEVSRVTKPTKSGPKVYDAVDRYFTEMGIGEAIDSLIQATPHTSIHWMTRDELAETELATDNLGADQLIHQANLALKGGPDLVTLDAMRASTFSSLLRPRPLLPDLLTVPKSTGFKPVSIVPVVPLTAPTKPAPVPAAVPVPAVITRARAFGSLQAGFYNNAPIAFDVELDWQNDFPYFVLVVTSKQADLPDLDHALTLDVYSSDLQAHRLVPLGPSAPRKLKGALTAEQTCSLRSDPTLEIMIEPRSGSGVWGQTSTLNLAGFHDLTLLIEAACKART